MVEIVMTLDSLTEIRAERLPPGFALRPYRAGDEKTWFDIQQSTGIYGTVSPELFEREFGTRPEALPERQLFVRDASGLDVATATAWFPAPTRPAQCGRVHWVAVRPAFQRRRIGAAVTCAVLERLASLGHDRAYLTTGAENVPAVSLYLRLGFRPSIDGEQERRAWGILAGRLSPELR